MFKFCLLVGAALVLGAQAQKERLVGADAAAIGEFPYQVSLRIAGSHFCGGALISEKHVLTAAHCVVAARKNAFGALTATVGTNSVTSGGKTYRVVEKSQHPSYVDKKVPDWKHDIGVFTLGSEVALSDLIGLAKLPTSDVEAGSEAVVSGWGTMKSPDSPLSQVLQKLTLNIIDQSSCQSMFPSFAPSVDSTQICTFVSKGKGLCSGDSGGPLAQDGVVIGVVSGGIPCAVGYPDVFTNVYQHLSYVNEVIGQ